MDPRTIVPGADRWLTDSRVYNLLWLGRWIERAQSVARVLRWSAEHAATNRMQEVLAIAAEIRGVTMAQNESALEALLLRDNGASVCACLAAARYNATQVAPLEVIRGIGTVIEWLERHDPPPTTPAELSTLMQRTLELLHDLHAALETAWFHPQVPSEEEVYRRFVQQQRER